MKKILLVDDSKSVLLMHRLLLEGMAHQILTATNGKEAVELARAQRPDVIFLDVVMPQMGGLEACRALRAMPETKDIPIILVTTRGEPDEVAAGYEAGCNDYITKPFKASEVIARLDHFLKD